MKVKWKSLCLALVLIAVWLFLIFFVFPTGSEGKESEISLPSPPGTAAVIFHKGLKYSIQSPNPEDVERALMESEPSWWIGTGKWIAGGSAAAATFFYFASLDIPAIHPFWIGKGGAAVLSATFSAIATVTGISVIWVDNRRSKLTWEKAKFCSLSPGEQVTVLKFPDGNVALMIIEGKLEKYLIAETVEFLVISKEEMDLPHHTLLDAQILYFKEKPLLPSRELKREEVLKIDSKILVIY